MTLCYIVIFLLCVCQIKLCKDGFYEDYLERTQTNCIKGLFILVVFVRHINQYIASSGYGYTSLFDRYFNQIDHQIGQLLVVMFLFYSGYGVMESIKRKGNAYIQSIPKHRFLATLLNFDVAVLLFVLLDILLSIKVSPGQVILSFTGWSSVGNSNWYIFVILICYLAVYISHKITPPESQYTIYQPITLIAIVMVLILGLYFTKGSYWYNTMLSFPAGFIYSQYKNRLESLFKSYYCGCLICVLAMFALLHAIRSYEVITYNLQSVAFAIIVVLLTMKVKVGNKLLLWLGVNLFPLYIYQRIPMLAMQEILGSDFIQNYTAIYIIVCLAITCLFARCYRHWQIKLR